MSVKFFTTILISSAILLGICINSNAQVKECNKGIPVLIVKSINPNYSGDSCYYHSTLMAIRFGPNAKVLSIEFSDNAEEWLKEELVRIKKNKKIDVAKIEKIARDNKLANVTMIFPMIFGTAFDCLKGENFDYSICGNVDEFFKFNKKPLKGNILICDTYTVGSGRPSH